MAVGRGEGPGPRVPAASVAVSGWRWRPRLLKGAAVLAAVVLALFLLEQIPAVRRFEQRITMSTEHRRRLDVRVAQSRDDKKVLNEMLWSEWLARREESAAGRSSQEWEEQVDQAHALVADLTPARRKEAYCEYWTIQQRALDEAVRDAWAAGLDHSTDPIEFEGSVFEAVRQAQAKAMFTGPNLEFTDVGLVQGLEPWDDAIEGWCESCSLGERERTSDGYMCDLRNYTGENAHGVVRNADGDRSQPPQQSTAPATSSTGVLLPADMEARFRSAVHNPDATNIRVLSDDDNRNRAIADLDGDDAPDYVFIGGYDLPTNTDTLVGVSLSSTGGSVQLIEIYGSFESLAVRAGNLELNISSDALADSAHNFSTGHIVRRYAVRNGKVELVPAQYATTDAFIEDLQADGVRCENRGPYKLDPNLFGSTTHAICAGDDGNVAIFIYGDESTLERGVAEAVATASRPSPPDFLYTARGSGWFARITGTPSVASAVEEFTGVETKAHY